MKAEQLILEIEKLQMSDKLKIIEQTAHSVRIDSERKKMASAAKLLASDYSSDQELTAFLALDGEEFYETR
jgi:hypothetical protein